MLESAGHEVLEFTRHSDTIRKVGKWNTALGAARGALATPWNPFSFASMRETILRERPDILHVHNTFPLLSPAVLHATRGSATAAVLTLHNYRLGCAAGIPLRNGVPCTVCLDSRSVLPALRYGCYRDSRLATIPVAAMISLHRRVGTWHRHVDAFIALTSFQRDLLVQAGLPRERVHVKPHFHPDPPSPIAWDRRDDKAVFIGRLSGEKGAAVLIRAWKLWGERAPVLEIVGDGPERSSLQAELVGTSAESKVRFLGQVPFEEGQRLLQRARLLVLPSVSFEGFPMVIREAFACGVPVIASRLGSMACLVEEGITGALFNPGDALDLLRIITKVWGDPLKLPRMAEASRATFDGRYTEEINHETLMDIYSAAIAHRLKMEWAD